VIAVFLDGPENGRELTLIGFDAPEVLRVPEPYIPPPIDLGPPAPGEEVRRVTYRYVRSGVTEGVSEYLHLYEREPGQEYMDYVARHPRPVEEPEADDSGRKAASRTFGQGQGSSSETISTTRRAESPIATAASAVSGSSAHR
jgi:hypothetical protein